MKTRISYIKLVEVRIVNGERRMYEICTFGPNPVIAGEVARAMCAADPKAIYQTLKFNEDDEIIGEYHPY